MKKTHTSPKKLPRVSTNLKKTMPAPVVKKRDNIFSKSRDIREDRATRQMKTMHNPQTTPHPQ